MSSEGDFLKYIAQTSTSPIGLVIDYADKEFLFTKNGRKYIDFISGIAVSSLGHNHPEVTRAVCDQVNRYMHVMVYGEFIQDPQVKFAKRLTDLLPDNLNRIYFTNSGTEANEGALKLAKKFTGKSKLIAFHNSYHGDSHGSLSVTGRQIYRDPFLPLLPDVTFLDFNDFNLLELITVDTACVIIEPIQGEGGIRPADKSWLKALRNKCNTAGCLLIFDEIQSGFGRTGHLFAFEHYEVVPDILTTAKAMGGGMPLGGIISSDEIFKVFAQNPPLNHVTTFGGHPVSCAAALASLNVLLGDNLMQRANMIETYIRGNLSGIEIVEIRGMGAMLGLELDSVDKAKELVQYCFEKGIILGWTLHSNNLIRLAPPLTISEDSLKYTISVINEILTN